MTKQNEFKDMTSMQVNFLAYAMILSTKHLNDDIKIYPEMKKGVLNLVINLLRNGLYKIIIFPDGTFTYIGCVREHIKQMDDFLNELLKNKLLYKKGEIIIKQDN